VNRIELQRHTRESAKFVSNVVVQRYSYINRT
jgi:hypothetical protein